MTSNNSHRLIITTARNRGRSTKAQQQALIDSKNLLIKVSDDFIDFADCFENDLPVVCEIGFGNGDCLCELARLHPDYNFLGIDIYLPGIGAALVKVKALGLSNIRVIHADARQVWPFLKNNSLYRIHVLFSDPWPKKRNYKRRLIQEKQLCDWLDKLCFGGKLYLATDDASYQKHIDWQLSTLNDVCLVDSGSDFMLNCPKRPMTKYESRGLRLGHLIRDWCIEKTN